MGNFYISVLTGDDCDKKYALMPVKDPLTLYLLTNGKGYIGDVPLAGSGSSNGIGTIKDNTNSLTITQSNNNGNLVYQVSVNKADTVNENDLKTIIDDLSNNQSVDMSSYSDNKFITEKQFVTILSKLLKDYALKANVLNVKPNNPTNTNP